MMKLIRSHLAWKVFLSYLLAIFVGAVVLITAASLYVPAAFERHIASMDAIMINGNKIGANESLQTELFSQYTAAVYEAVSYAAVAALITAILASFFISRQVVAPTLQMTRLSHRIAEGEYKGRLKIPGDNRQTRSMN